MLVWSGYETGQHLSQVMLSERLGFHGSGKVAHLEAFSSPPAGTAEVSGGVADGALSRIFFV